jgi:arylsulfatase A-like enzyme
MLLANRWAMVIVIQLMSAAWTAVGAQQAVGQPALNVLFIVIDDLNDWVGPLGGHPQVRTPGMDSLAQRGLTFTNAHCQSPLCNPSRTSVLTGLRPSTTGVYALAPWFRDDNRFRDHPTLLQWFRRHGYITVSTGKVFHGGYPPKAQRYQEADQWGPDGRLAPRPAMKFVKTPDPHPLVDWGIFPETDQDCFDYDIATWASAWLRQAPKDKPWFLAVGFQHPHVPCYAPRKWFELYPENRLVLPPIKEDDRDDLPRFASYLHWRVPEPRLHWLQATKQWRPLVRAYLASISFVDSQVGRILQALETSGQTERTVVVLWSDHGWHLGEKGITGKNTLWERSTHVPLLFAGPGIPTGQKCHQPVELLDLYPTLAEVCGFKPPAGLEGLSLVPLLKNPQASRKRPAITTHNPGNHAIRTERWRYIRYADGSEELYDLKTDPHEWHNLAGRPGYENVRQQLAQWLPRQDAPPMRGSAGRLLVVEKGIPYWEGQPIRPQDPFPDQ